MAEITVGDPITVAWNTRKQLALVHVLRVSPHGLDTDHPAGAGYEFGECFAHEGLRWIRGHHAVGSDEANALLSRLHWLVLDAT